MKLEKGKSYRIDYGKDNISNKKIHIVIIEHDDGSDLVVYKYWSRKKQWWIYQLDQIGRNG
ncbi:hypothetical protein LCGC14_2167750 [marine sediment metagenome]|uniref:Uncharacterized protein n=1 Tax=marine sediment metagenome TaxID=412755 RepID=A0A0F9G3K5_9ZZZZ